MPPEMTETAPAIQLLAPAAPPVAPMPAPAPPPDLLVGKLAGLVALLRAVGEIEKSFHWRTRGENFISQHGLFSRVYETTDDDIDNVAEKLIGITGCNDALDPVAQLTMSAQLAQQLAPSMDPQGFVASALAAETALMQALLDILSCKELLTPGLDNLLQGMADKHETSVYLLRQSLALGK